MHEIYKVRTGCLFLTDTAGHMQAVIASALSSQVQKSNPKTAAPLKKKASPLRCFHSPTWNHHSGQPKHLYSVENTEANPYGLEFSLLFAHLGTVTSDVRSPFQVDRKFCVEIWPLTRWLQKIPPFGGGSPVCFRSVSYRDVNLTQSWFPCAVNHSSYHLARRSMTLLLLGLCRVLIPAKIASPLSTPPPLPSNFSLFETKKHVPVAMGVAHRSMGEM